MKGILKYLPAFVLSFLAFACSKSENADAPILFSIDGGFGVDRTKSAITTANLASNIVKVYAKKNNVPLSGMSPGQIGVHRGAFWSTSAPVVTWDNGRSYVFQGYAYTASGISAVSDDGLAFTVTQPSDMSDPSAMADFVVSGQVEVTSEQSALHPLVSLEFEHILPSVEVYVTYSSAMRDVTVSDITLSGLFYGARMTYSIQDGIWVPSVTTARDASYTLAGPVSVATTREDTEARMTILSVPQSFSTSTRISITYQVNESMTATPDFKEHSQVFHLSDYVTGLSGGHRTVFHIDIDTGIHLQATIAEWKKIDFIEGTVLPPIQN